MRTIPRANRNHINTSARAAARAQKRAVIQSQLKVPYRGDYRSPGARLVDRLDNLAVIGGIVFAGLRILGIV